MIEKILLMCCVVATAIVSSPSSPESELSARVQDADLVTSDGELFLGIGDRLELSDAFHPEELHASELVLTDGTVLLPELGAVQVAGLTRAEVEAWLMEEYSTYYDGLDIQVRIVPARKTFFLFGEVDDQGPRRFEGELTIWEAVMLNRPDMRSANLASVRLFRADPPDALTITVDVARMNATGDTSANVHVQERDLIYVPPACPAPTVPELLAQASAGMDAFARNASAQEAERVRQLVAALQAISAEFEILARWARARICSPRSKATRAASSRRRSPSRAARLRATLRTTRRA